jgi:hypothetical protein
MTQLELIECEITERLDWLRDLSELLQSANDNATAEEIITKHYGPMTPDLRRDIRHAIILRGAISGA